jgi:pilus assembly protein CpaC
MEDGGGLSGLYGRSSLALVVLFGLFLSWELAPSQEVEPSITVTVNQSVVFGLAQKARRVSVTQPEIAEVVVVSPNQLLINGKSVGATSLVVWDQKGQVTKFDLLVLPDIAALRRQLKALFSEEKIEVSTSGAAIVLRGEVSNESVYDKVLEITQSYLPPKPKEAVAAPAPSQVVSITAEPRLPTTGTAFAGGGQLAFVEEGSPTDVDRWGNKRAIEGIIDLLVIKEVRQIELDVVVAEISLIKLRELGLDFAVFGRTTSFQGRAGSQAGFPGGTLLGNITPATPGRGVDIPALTFGGPTSAILTHVSNSVQVATLYRLFQNRDITEILAQPKLVIKNGRSGGFLAGGEFPFPVPQATGAIGAQTVTIQFKPFGVRLDFLPTITWSNSIDLRVFPEVSEIDPTVQTLISGISVPGLKVRRSVSRVEIKEGESLILSGLLDRRVLKDLTKFPLLGDIPYLGALFRGTRFRNQETELIFLITPKVVKALRPGERPKIPSIEKYDHPDMRQIPIPGGSSETPDTSSGKTAVEESPTIP